MPTRDVLIASGIGDDPPGGLYALEDGAFATLDNSDTTGLAVSTDGARLARVLFTDDDPQTSGEFFLYDRRGVLTYRRIDALQEPHALAWRGDALLAVSTLINGVLWLDEHGSVLRTWTAGGEGDCWHLNTMLVRDGRVLACAFGRFDSHRAWSRPGARDGAGIVFDVETGEDVITGLTAPHDPLWVDGGWLVCNSGTRELVRLDPAGTVMARRDLGGWTRGLTVDDKRVYVGVSSNRLSDRRGAAVVVALDRATLAEVDRWPLPCREVFALVWVSRALLEGLRAGLAVNSQHLSEGDRTDVFATAARSPIPAPDAAELDVRLTVEQVPTTVAASGAVTLPFVVENRGRAGLASLGTRPILVGARWVGDDGEPLGQEARARLPHTVTPGERAGGKLRAMAPAEPGSYRLRVALVQEHVRWFDDLSPHAILDAPVTVVATPRG
jgi:hypothetical protein